MQYLTTQLASNDSEYSDLFHSQLEQAADDQTYAVHDKLHNEAMLVEFTDHGNQYAIVRAGPDRQDTLSFSYISQWCELVRV